MATEPTTSDVPAQSPARSRARTELTRGKRPVPRRAEQTEIPGQLDIFAALAESEGRS